MFASRQSSVQVFSSEVMEDVQNSFLHTASQSDYVWTPSARSTDILMRAGLELRKLRSVPVFAANCKPRQIAKSSLKAEPLSSKAFLIFRFDTKQTDEEQLRSVLNAWCSAFQGNGDVTLVITCDKVQKWWVAKMISSAPSTCARISLLRRVTTAASQAKEDVFLSLFPAQNKFADELTALQEETIVLYTECAGSKELLSTEFAVKVRSIRFCSKIRDASCYLTHENLVTGPDAFMQTYTDTKKEQGLAGPWLVHFRLIKLSGT